VASTLWIGNLQFGGISVPVKLHTAVSQNRVQFHLLHKADRVKLRQQMICRFDKMPVPAEEQVKGFQVDERKYILIDPEELEKAEPESSRVIDVHEFVNNGTIDPVFIERIYYLEPDASSETYRVLASALADMDVQGICTWVMRKRAYFGAVQSQEKSLRLKVLRYADELVPVQSLGLESFELSEKEVAIGSEIINKLTVAFQPEKYVNDHQKKLKEMIEKKAHGRKVELFTPRHHTPTTPGALLDALEKSLKKVA